MLASEAIQDVMLKATGKTTTLASTSTKYLRILGLLDFYQRRWARERGIDWNSLYNLKFSLGTITATDTFDIDTSTIRKLSDREGDAVRVVWTNGVGYTDYDIVVHDKLKDYSQGVNRESPNGFYAAKIGGTLVFNHTFVAADAQFGGEIFVPCYVFADEITVGTDEIQVDDPDWLILQVAAEYVRNDITRRSRYPELQAEANEAMQRMRDDNDAQIDLVERPWAPASGLNGSAWS